MRNNSNKICFLLFIILITISTSSIAIEEDDPEKDLVTIPSNLKVLNLIINMELMLLIAVTGLSILTMLFLKNLALMIELVPLATYRQKAGRLRPKEQKNALTKQKA